MFARKHRTYSLTSLPSSQPASTTAAAAAASAALSGSSNSRCNSLSSQAAAAALRRYSLTQDSLRSVPGHSNYTSAPSNNRPSSVRSLRQNSQHTTTKRVINEDRSMSLTRTTVKKLGSFEVTTTKTTLLAPPAQSHSRSTGKRTKKKKKTSSILSYESDLNSVLEEDTDYGFTQNFSAIHEIPRTIPSPAPRPIRSALKSNNQQHARKYSTGSRVSFSSQSSVNQSVSHYVNNNTSVKNTSVVDSDSSSGNSIYSDASEFLPPVIVDIVNNQCIITTPPDLISPPSSQYSPNSSPPQLTAQQHRRSTYSTNERISEYLSSKNGTNNETKSIKTRPIPNKLAARKEIKPPADYTRHVLKRTPSSSSFERERTERRGAARKAGGFKQKTMREPNLRQKSKQLPETSATGDVQQQPHVAPFRSRFEDSDSESDLSVWSKPTPVTKQKSPNTRRFSLRSSNRESVLEPVRLQAESILEEEPVKPVKKKKFQQLRRVFGLL